MASDHLLVGLEEKWKKATAHEFITACIEGTVKPEQFNRWLAQDYYYVRGFTPFAGSLLQSAPDNHIEVIIAGIAALTDELSWFKATAKKKGLDLPSISMQPACIAYRAFMHDLYSAPYAVKAAAFWAIEKCYHEAWASVLNNSKSEELKEYSHRWGNPDFGVYVQQLKQHVDEALAQSPDHIAAAKAVVEKVADLEVDFWAMAYNECNQD